MAINKNRLVRRLMLFQLCFALGGRVLAQEREAELNHLAENLTGQLTSLKATRIAVLDFTDSTGSSGRLGKYVANRLNADLLLCNGDFSILDREGLNGLLTRHVPAGETSAIRDKANALKMFANVDMLIIGSSVPIGQDIAVTARIITADTAEMVGVGRARFRVDPFIQKLLSQTTAGDHAGGNGGAVTNNLGTLTVVLQSLELVNSNHQYLLTMQLANNSPDNDLWVAMSGGASGTAHQTVTDPNGAAFVNQDQDVSGVASTQFYAQSYSFNAATEIKPGASISATIRFSSLLNETATAGQCEVHLGFLVGEDFQNDYGKCRPENLVATLKAR